MSPIYIREGGLAYGWYSDESGEPPHVHVFKGASRGESAKFWLRSDGVELAHNKLRLSTRELRQAKLVVTLNRFRLLAVWHDYFEG